MHTRKIKSAAKTALFYGVDGSRTRNAIFPQTLKIVQMLIAT